MKSALLVCFALLGLISLQGCGTDSPPPSPPAVGAPLAASVTTTPLLSEDMHLIVATQGSINVRREGWTEFAPVFLGTRLQYGDLLQAEGSGQATVVCADLSVKLVQHGTNPVPCSPPVFPQSELTKKGDLVNPTRSGPCGKFPRVASPRKTKLLNPRPRIRWTPLDGASTYTVSVQGEGVGWSRNVASASQLAYPHDEPDLLPGATYKVIVTSGNSSSEEEQLPGRGFTMLTTTEAHEVRDGTRKIGGLGLSEIANSLLVANMYASRGLYADAIEHLEVVEHKEREPAMARLLGEIYLSIGVTCLAQQHYVQAEQVSEQANDREGLALARHALGLIDEALGNNAEAIRKLQQAKDHYQTLGDARTVGAIQERLTSLEERERIRPTAAGG